MTDYLDALLDIKRLAGKASDLDTDCYALLDLIAERVRAAFAQAKGDVK